METSELVQSPSPETLSKKEVRFDEKNFFPSGAVAFFVVLIALGLITWFGIYFLMLERI
ncbi:MAG: cytochrome c oxidase subunit 2A [Flavisolibacter sp.]